MKTYFKNHGENLFTIKHKRLVFDGSKGREKPQEALQSSLPNPQEAKLQRETGMSKEDIQAYRDKYNFAELDQKLGMKLKYDKEAYKPHELYRRLSGKNEELSGKFKTDRKKYEDELKAYEAEMNKIYVNGHLAMPVEKIAELGRAFAGTWEKLSEANDNLVSNLNGMKLVQDVMSVHELKYGEISPTEVGKRKTANDAFQEREHTSLNEAIVKLGNNPVDLVETVKSRLQKQIEERIANEIAKAEKWANPLTDEDLNTKMKNDIDLSLKILYNSMSITERGLITEKIPGNVRTFYTKQNSHGMRYIVKYKPFGFVQSIEYTKDPKK